MSKCLDLNLMSDESIDFYLISSRDNIIIEVNGVIICYTRDDVKNEAYKYKNFIYFGKKSALPNVMITKTDYNKLINRKYDIYKIYKNKDEKIHFVQAYKMKDLLF